MRTVSRDSTGTLCGDRRTVPEIHLKRSYGLRSRLRVEPGAKTTTGWGILAYNLDTLTIRTA